MLAQEGGITAEEYLFCAEQRASASEHVHDFAVRRMLESPTQERNCVSQSWLDMLNVPEGARNSSRTWLRPVLG